MRLAVFALCAALVMASTQSHAQSANDVHASWAKLQVSDHKDDKALVAQIQKMDWWKTCAAWGAEARKKVKTKRMWAMQDYLNTLNYINGVDLGGVTGKLPEIGMTTCGAYAVLGLPETVNQSKSAHGTRVQHVWRNRGVYVYTQSRANDGNALVTSLQH